MSNRKTGVASSAPMDDYWRENLKAPEFKREYEALELEFSIRRQRETETPAKRVTATGTRGKAIKQAGSSRLRGTRRKLKA